MKILILLKKWEGGVGSVVKYIQKEFEKKGHEVKVISREDDLGTKSLLRSIFPLRSIVKRLMKEEGFDVIYAQDWSLAFPFLFPWKIFKERLYGVFYGNNPPATFFIQTHVGKALGKNLIVCNDVLNKRFPASTLIYNRVDHNTFKPSKKVKRVAGSVGFSNWKTDEYSFNAIKTAVEKCGKNLVIAEGIPKEKMPEFYRTLEYFISLPPKHAGFGLVYLEAMASNVPKIIGSNYGGGSVLPITKIEDFGDISKAIDGAKKKDYREWILKNNFTWENAVKELLEIFSHSGDTKDAI